MWSLICFDMKPWMTMMIFRMILCLKMANFTPWGQFYRSPPIDWVFLTASLSVFRVVFLRPHPDNVNISPFCLSIELSMSMVWGLWHICAAESYRESYDDYSKGLVRLNTDIYTNVYMSSFDDTSFDWASCGLSDSVNVIVFICESIYIDLHSSHVNFFLPISKRM